MPTKPQATRATVRKSASAPAVSNITSLSSRLQEAATFVREAQGAIMRDAPAAMAEGIAVKVYCVLNRAHNALGRRLGDVRTRIDDIISKKEPLKPGEKEMRIESGPFAVVVRNTAHLKKNLNKAKLKVLLESKGISPSAVMYVPAAAPPPPPFVNEDLVKKLAIEGNITAAELDALYELAPVAMRVEVDVPDYVDQVIESRLLGLKK